MPNRTIIPRRVVAEMIRPRPGFRLLFAYGDDMTEAVLGERCPDPLLVCTATIPSRRFI
jgi:hypothetical protein